MKEIKFMAMSMLVLGAVACSEKEEPKPEPVLKPIQEVIAKDGDTEVKAVIDHSAKTIKFEPFKELEEITAVEVKFTLAEGAKLVEPAQLVGKFDFTKPIKVVVNNRVVDLTYEMTGSQGKPDYIKKAGFVLTEEYGDLPEYIKVYKHNKLGEGENESGWLVAVDAKGSSIALSDFYDPVKDANAKSIAQVAKENSGYAIHINGMCGMKSCHISGGEYKYSSSGAVAAFAVTKDGKFMIAPQKRVQKADKSYTIAMLDKTGKVVNEDWGKDLSVAFGGTALMADDGKALTPEEQKATDGGYSFGWWNGNAGHAREAIGVSEKGDKAYFFICGNDKGGLSMKAVQELMLEINCWDVMFVEGSKSANILVRGKQTWTSNDGSKKTSHVLMIK